nr:MAG TPA: hypothetical protein [Caudoviricetes sp.]
MVIIVTRSHFKGIFSSRGRMAAIRAARSSRSFSIVMAPLHIFVEFC